MANNNDLVSRLQILSISFFVVSCIIFSCDESRKSIEKETLFETDQFDTIVSNELNFNLSEITRELDPASVGNKNFCKELANEITIVGMKEAWSSVNLGIQVYNSEGVKYNIEQGDSLALVLSGALEKSFIHAKNDTEILNRYQKYIANLNPDKRTIIYQDFFHSVDAIKNFVTEDELKYLLAFSLLYVSLEQMQEREDPSSRFRTE